MNEASRRDWQPAASLAALEFRAAMLAEIRAFFAARQCLEVNTPVLAAAAATDPQIESFALDEQGRRWWLQSSPEFHMKRLLAAGSGAIYQIGPAFRREEQGRWHNPEFFLLEWYRPGFDHHQLMDEVEALWKTLAGTASPPELPRHRYADLLQARLGLDCLTVELEVLRAALQGELGELPGNLDRNALLDAAMGLLVGPELGLEAPCFVYDYPASQAALAQVREDGWASRFELYWRGIELANGFHELADAKEQRRRFEADLSSRASHGLASVALDEALLQALDAGLPPCAGVALGVDRLAALLMGAAGIAPLIAFPADRA